MNYRETLDYLYSKLPMFQRMGKAAYKSDLGNTLILDRYFHHPHKNFKSVHIGGTNGKGSVAHMLVSILQVAGYKVGLYTSPHLQDFRERIKVNGNKIPEEEVILFVNKHSEFFDQIKPSFFEMTVALAFNYFSNQKVDIAVVEVGLGGRLDSTNIINPLVSVITSIGIDHTEYLGDTIQKIAHEKAGIIKQNTPLVIGEAQKKTEEIFIEEAKVKNSDICFADKLYGVEPREGIHDLKQSFNIFKNGKLIYEDLRTDILGKYQVKNIPAVLKLVDILKNNNFDITDEHIYNGLDGITERTGFYGRWQILNKDPLTICDCAHNEDGLRYVIKQLGSLENERLLFVFGMVGDKETEKILSILPKKAKYYFTRADIPRALDAKELAMRAKQFGLTGEVFPAVKEAFIRAKKEAKKNDLIFIGGSTFVVAEVLEDLDI